MKILDTASGLISDRTIGVSGNGSGHVAATFYVEVTGITRTSGTLEVEVFVKTAAGTNKSVAEITGLTGTGIAKLPVNADFLTFPDAIPEPDEVNWRLVGDTTAVSGRVYAIYGA